MFDRIALESDGVGVGLVGFGMWDLASSHWVPIPSGTEAWFSSNGWGIMHQVSKVRCRSGNMISSQGVPTVPVTLEVLVSGRLLILSRNESEYFYGPWSRVQCSYISKGSGSFFSVLLLKIPRAKYCASF